LRVAGKGGVGFSGRQVLVLGLVGLLVFAGAGCGAGGSDEASGSQAAEGLELLLATTTSTYDSGLLDVLIPAFEKKYGYEVKILPRGTGAALELGKRGDVDVLLVHAKEMELRLVEEGYFVDRRDVMSNDFVVVGSASDPAGIQGVKNAALAFERIARTGSPFVSRGDNSGTNIKEAAIWKKAGIEPAGAWYLSVGQGMGDTLRIANERRAYTLTDRATYISLKDKLDLEVLVEGDPFLFNQYGIMAVNPKEHPRVNYEGARKLIEFMVSPEGQEIIGTYAKYGERLFVPNAGQ